MQVRNAVLRAMKAPVIAGSPHGKDVPVAHLSDIVIYPHKLPAACRLHSPSGLLSYTVLHCPSKNTQKHNLAPTHTAFHALKDCAAEVVVVV